MFTLGIHPLLIRQDLADMSGNLAAAHDPDVEVTHVKLAVCHGFPTPVIARDAPSKSHGASVGPQDGSAASLYRTHVWDRYPVFKHVMVLLTGSTMLFWVGPGLAVGAWYLSVLTHLHAVRSRVE